MIDPFSSALHPCCGPETEVFSATSSVTADHILATHLKKVPSQERHRMTKEIIIKRWWTRELIAGVGGTKEPEC